MATTTFNTLKFFLDEQNTQYDTLEHPAYESSAEGLAVTGLTAEQVAKSLLYTAMGKYVLAVLPLAARTGSGKLRRAMGAKDVRLASPDELSEIMGCEPGTCHPIGRIIDLRTIVDKSLQESEVIGIGTGDHERTITLPYAEYTRIALPEVVDIRAYPQAN